MMEGILSKYVFLYHRGLQAILFDTSKLPEKTKRADKWVDILGGRTLSLRSPPEVKPHFDQETLEKFRDLLNDISERIQQMDDYMLDIMPGAPRSNSTHSRYRLDPDAELTDRDVTQASLHTPTPTRPVFARPTNVQVENTEDLYGDQP
jgi:hypothetical protein